MRDWRGTEIQVGSRVIYPSRQGGQMWMNEGEVVSVGKARIGIKKTKTNSVLRSKQNGNGHLAFPNPLRITVIE